MDTAALPKAYRSVHVDRLYHILCGFGKEPVDPFELFERRETGKGNRPLSPKSSGKIAVYSVAGEYDLVAIIRREEYEHLAEIVTEKLQALESVQKTITLMAFRNYKFLI